MENTYVPNPWDDLPASEGERLTYIKTGVLWVQKEPYYIVELVKEPEHNYVLVYGVQPNTSNPPKKLAKEVVIKSKTFSNRTRLGVIANAILPKKSTKKWVTEPPLFVAPLIPEHVATLTQKKEPGFFEREPDRESTQAGEKRLIRGRNTGIFIGLSSIQWEEGYRIPTESIIDVLKSKQSSGFYDLEGDNSNNSNPLSQYYREQRWYDGE